VPIPISYWKEPAIPMGTLYDGCPFCIQERLGPQSSRPNDLIGQQTFNFDVIQANGVQQLAGAVADGGRPLSSGLGNFR
jgi:hypothetical protein